MTFVNVDIKRESRDERDVNYSKLYDIKVKVNRFHKRLKDIEEQTE